MFTEDSILTRSPEIFKTLRLDNRRLKQPYSPVCLFGNFCSCKNNIFYKQNKLFF